MMPASIGQCVSIVLNCFGHPKQGGQLHPTQDGYWPVPTAKSCLEIVWEAANLCQQK